MLTINISSIPRRLGFVSNNVAIIVDFSLRNKCNDDSLGHIHHADGCNENHSHGNCCGSRASAVDLVLMGIHGHDHIRTAVAAGDDNNNYNDNGGAFIGDGKSLSDVEMARRKEMIMMASLKRRQQQEQLRLRKENEQAMRRAHEQARRDEAERKREDDKRRREIILEQYRLRKAQEEAEKNGAPPVHHASLMAGKCYPRHDYHHHFYY